MANLEIPAIRVDQNERTFYVGAFSAQRLLRIAYVQKREEGEGVQRILSAKRLKEIGEYLTSTRRPGLLPNAIILGLSSRARYDTRKAKLVVPDSADQAFVIDGQHRLFAFRYVGDFDMEVPFSAFLDPPLEEIAYLFRTINSTQRKINPSLVYDLIPLLRGRDWVDFEESRAQYLVQRLSEEPQSPWYRRISMLGGRDQPITQASFVTAIKRLLKDGEVLSESFMNGDFFGQEIQYELLESYFIALATVFVDEWHNPNYVVSKNLGVSAFLNILKPILQELARRRKRFFSGDSLSLKPADFAPFIKKARASRSWRRADMAKTYLGAAGIRSLTDELAATVR